MKNYYFLKMFFFFSNIFLIFLIISYYFNVFSYNYLFSLEFLLLLKLGWPLGRRVGLGPPPWDLLWLSLVASLVLDAFWGPLWMHLGPFWSSFQAFRHPMASYLPNFNHVFDLHTDVFSNSDVRASFFFSMQPYVKRHGRPNFPKVVSSCYRAGNWEWV